MRMLVLVPLTAAGALVAGLALAQPTVKTVNGVMAGDDGKPFYTYENDTTPGKSACNGQCTSFWPPVAASGEAKASGDWSIITRDDGSKQWAYKGKPLYTFARDQNGRPPMGESVYGWKLVK